MVNTNHGSHFRKPHERQQEVNVPEITATKNKKTVENKSIESVSKLKKNDGGISDGVEKVTFKDGKTAFFKPAEGEPFVRKVSSPQDQPNLNFESFHLNNKNNEKLSLTDHKKYQNKENAGRGEVKGHMIDREMATSLIGKALGMDHLPDVGIRTIDNRVGSIAENLIELHSGDNVTAINKYEITTGDDAFKQIAKTDPKAGDKALFDFIVGNADRHGGNFLHKLKKDGNSEMLAFDHGFTFPSSNSLHQSMDFYNQEKFDNYMKNSKFTDQMIQNVKKFITSGASKKASEFIADKIGKKEAGAFNERMSLIQEKVLNKGARTTGEIGYRSERFMT